MPFIADAVTITPSAASSLIITVDGVAVASGSASQALTVDPGASRSVPVIVSDGLLSTRYTVTVMRQDASGFAQQAYIKASNADPNDHFGFAVAASTDGNTLAVGAYGEDSGATGVNGDTIGNSASGSGAVYVFSRSGTTWTQQAYLKASNAEPGDAYGNSVVLSSDGNTLAVGAPNEASGISGNQSDNSKPGAGAVYVFARSGTTWSQQAYVKASNPHSNDFFGSSAALSYDGNTLAVGAYGEASNATGIDGNQTDVSKAQAGAVYVFTRSGNSWAQQAYVKASNTDAGDFFGIGLALSADGNTMSVGAPNEGSAAAGVNANQSDNSAPKAGAVYVFARSGTTWSQEAYIKSSNPHGNLISTTPIGGGGVITVLSGDAFGAAVASSADGNTLAVSAGNEQSAASGVGGNQADTSKASAGAVYVFVRSGTTWSQQAYVKATNPDINDFFAAGLGSVKLSSDGNILAVGAFNEASAATGINGIQADNSLPRSGAVYIYTRNGATWTSRAYVKADNIVWVDGKGFGNAVAISADGTLFVGSDNDDVSSSGINGARTASGSTANYGSVSVFR